MVIVCEDTVMAPSYLRKIKDEVLRLGHWADIAIYPLPPSEIGTAKNNNPNKSPRKLRALLAGEPGSDAQILDIEEEHRAVPTRYVREGQKRIESEGHEEGWAVYDLDGHPAQEAARQLSLTPPVIQIAFSSIAIEHWFLLHFVRDDTAYPKSEDVPINVHIPGYTKTTKGAVAVFQQTYSRLEIALENAGWLRSKYTGNPAPFHTYHPYVSTDLLMKSLFNIAEEISWAKPAIAFTICNLTITAERSGAAIKVTLTNHSGGAIVANQIKICWIDANRTKTEYTKPNAHIPLGAKWEWQENISSPGLLNLTIGNNRLILPF